MLFPQQNTVRRLNKLDGIWSFRTDPDKTGESQGWAQGIPAARSIAVPGSWNEQIPDLANYFGLAWFECVIYPDVGWAEMPLRLRIGAVNNNARVWINGTIAGEHRGPYLPMDIDLTGRVNWGQANRLVVCVDASLDPWMFPPATWVESDGRVGWMNSYPGVAFDFFPYGGIHRSVYLYTTGTPRIERISVVTTSLLATHADVTLTIFMADDFRGTVECLVEGTGVRLVSHGGRSVTGTLRIPTPRVWDIGRGELYNMEVRAEAADGGVDCYRQSFGIRTVEVKGDQFLLNGKPVFFKGFGKHEDFHIIGKGLLEPLVVRDFEMLKWIGANSFRTSHYPYAEEWLDYADRAGIMVIDETPFVGLSDRLYTDELLAQAQSIITELIHRDKNHPSVVMWSLANEPNCARGSAAVTTFFKGMATCARALDASRPITYVAHLEPEDNDGFHYYDVVCVNKYYGWYIAPGQLHETLPELEKCVRRFRDAFGKPVMLAEFGADAVDGVHRMTPELFSEEYQSEVIEKQYQLMRTLPWCIGTHVWAFADFKTAQSITRVANNRKGVFTRERNPKMAAHTLRRLWNPTPA